MNKLKQYVLVNITGIVSIPLIAFVLNPKKDNSLLFMLIILCVFLYDSFILFKVRKTSKQTFYRFLGYTISFIMIAMFSVIFMAMLIT
jgi:bacteriorhodopsin